MIKKLNRFTNQSTIKRLMGSRQQVRGSACTLKFLPGDGRNFRLAVVVSKKTAKSAVVRNRIRRRIFAWAEQNVDSLPVLDMVIFVHHQEFADIDSAELERRLKKLFIAV